MTFNANSKPTLLILAAGMGSRYGGLKQVDSVGPSGEAIIDYSIFDAMRAGFGKVVFVIRKDIEAAFREKISFRWEGKIAVEHVFQQPESAVPARLLPEVKREKPWGTAHAVLVAAEYIREPFAVINADDYYGIEAYRKMADFLNAQCTPGLFSMMGYVLGRTLSDHGTVSRGVCKMDADNYLTTVTERHKIRRENSGILFTDENGADVSLPESSLVSMNFWGFHPSIFKVIEEDFIKYVDKNLDNPKSEFYIPTVINRMIDEDGLKLLVIPNDDQWYGVTYREDKPIVENAILKMIKAGLYPASIWT